MAQNCASNALRETHLRKGIEMLKPRSPESLAVKLRGGAGKHGDRRLKRLKTRANVKRLAIQLGG
jgi:hypothetical protein